VPLGLWFLLSDGGDLEETLRVKPLGFVDGQTINPSLIAKNREVKKLIPSGRTLSEEEEVPSTGRAFRR
jgi:transaldolase